jgi:predicted RND superfamily exporter protein
MWKLLAQFILRFRAPILFVLLILTVIMGLFASRAKMKYDMGSAIPIDNPKYIEHLNFKKMFGEDGTMMVVGFNQQDVFEPTFFNEFKAWQQEIKKIDGVDNMLCIPTAINVRKQETDSTSKLVAEPIFSDTKNLDSSIKEFLNLPFYKNLLYNPETHSYLTAIYLNKIKVKTADRMRIIEDIETATEKFSKKTNTDIHYSGLPFIRTKFSLSVQYEMKLILIASLLLTALILFLFFRSFSTVLFSVLVVFAGVLWAVGLLYLMDYRISILTALIAPLIVVIGIPNCIYFLNKYHTQFALLNNKKDALISMVERMGIVTLFTNLTAAIGFGVFYFTKSQLLKEFGLVAGVSILVVFFISLFSIPAIFSYLKAPETKHTKYLENKFLSAVLLKFDYWVLNHKKYVTVFWTCMVLVSLLGIMKLKTLGFIVDDLPKQNKIYTDLNYFEKNFHGVMPLEIVVDTKKKNGATTLPILQKLDQLSASLGDYKQIAKPLSMVEAIKFARQAYYDGDSSSYGVPNSFDVAFLLPYLRMKSDSAKSSQFSQLISSFVDSSKRYARISVGIEDVGSEKLPLILNDIQQKANAIFDTTRYKVTFTGTSIVFLEGSHFIINSLRDSLLLALLMIVFCMIFLFRSWRIVIISLITNMIPLAITAGVMGFFNINLKPSTVLVFSIALGIAIDVTIRFLVNYKQDLPKYNYDIPATIKATIQETGISIIYTSLILSAGFIVFLVSQFDGTKALGYLTALTLFMAMITNLTILPALLVWFDKQNKG